MSPRPILLAFAAALAVAPGCNRDPKAQMDQIVGYRDVLADGPTTGERGTIKMTEVLWSGTVNADGDYDPTDVFVEFRNESARPAVLSGWRLAISGPVERELRLPEMEPIPVGGFAYIAAKTSGCFPEPDAVLPGLSFSTGDPVRLTLRDADERLMEPVGSRDMRPFAGGYDFRTSRSMERVNLMFGGVGTEPTSWHYATYEACPAGVLGEALTDLPDAALGLSCYEGKAQNDRMLPGCRAKTHATPGRSNSPDYTGAYASGGFE